MPRKGSEGAAPFCVCWTAVMMRKLRESQGSVEQALNDRPSRTSDVVDYSLSMGSILS